MIKNLLCTIFLFNFFITINSSQEVLIITKEEAESLYTGQSFYAKKQFGYTFTVMKPCLDENNENNGLFKLDELDNKKESKVNVYIPDENNQTSCFFKKITAYKTLQIKEYQLIITGSIITHSSKLKSNGSNESLNPTWLNFFSSANTLPNNRNSSDATKRFKMFCITKYGTLADFLTTKESNL